MYTKNAVQLKLIVWCFDFSMSCENCSNAWMILLFLRFQAILMSGRLHKKVNLTEYETLAWYISAILRHYLPSKRKNSKNFQGLCPPELPLGHRHESAATLTVPPDPHLYCRAILWSLFRKYNIRKLSCHGH